MIVALRLAMQREKKIYGGAFAFDIAFDARSDRSYENENTRNNNNDANTDTNTHTHGRAGTLQ